MMPKLPSNKNNSI